MSQAALAVDAGQTEIRAALVVDGRGVAGAAAPGVLRLGGGVGPGRVADGLLAAIAALGPLPGEDGAGGELDVAVGLSGFEAARDADLAEIADLVGSRVGARDVTLATDGLSALLGAVGARDGVVVASGTGTACLGRRGTRFAKVDGWGSLLGDAGSGFWIGRAGLDAALRHHDGRAGGSAVLAEAAVARFGPLDRLADAVYRTPVPTRAIAAFCLDVCRAADAGDERSLAIVAAAGRELATSALAAVDRLFEPGEPALVSWTGKVFGAGPPLLDAFAGELALRREAVEVVAPEADGLHGAAVLAALAPSLEPEPGVLWRRA